MTTHGGCRKCDWSLGNPYATVSHNLEIDIFVYFIQKSELRVLRH